MKNYLLLLLLVLPCLLFGQSGIVTGRVLDNTNFPLIGATVIVDGIGATVADEDGAYSISVPAGSYSAEVSYIGYETLTQEFTVEAKQVLEQNFILKTGVTLSEVVVTSNLQGQAKALNSQLSNANITNVIAADQIGRFPDANIGDAMKRIPGINVQYDQGEARFGNIRGTAPELSSVMINGERIPSAEAEVRSVQLDLVPSDMVQSVEVSKAVTPDMDADAIGGAVNLVTRSAPSQERVSATLGLGYNQVAEKLSGNVGLVYGNRYANDKLGVILSGSYLSNQLGSDNVEAEWGGDDASPELAELQIRQYYLQRTRQSYSATLDYKLAPNHTIFLKGMYNQRNDWENRYRAVYKDIEQDDNGNWFGEMERQTKAGIKDNKYGRLEDQDVLNVSLSGEHRFGKLSMDWSGNYARASEERPNERYLEYATDDVEALNLDITDLRKPFVVAQDAAFQKPTDSWEVKEISEEFQSTTDEDVNAKINFAYQLSTGDFASNLKFGLRSRNKSKERDNDFYEYKPVDDAAILAESLNNLKDLSKSGYLAGSKYQVGEFASREYVGGLDLGNTNLFEKEQVLDELAGNFSAKESILAGYAMLEQTIAKDLLVIAGLRVEKTDLEYQGFKYQEEDEDNGLEESLTPTEKTTGDYTNFLPGLHLKYNLNRRTVLRGAWTNTIARPNYYDLVPYREIAEGNELSIGNPSLKATESMNLDLMAEHYFGTIGIVSGGVFYKDIKNFIVNQKFSDYTFEGTEWADFTQPINGGNASLFGFEVAFQRQLDFIPALKGLGLYLNYTFTTSEVKNFQFEGRENEKISLPGSPEHTLNASLAYEGKKFTARLSYNFASDFISEVGGEAFEDIYYDKVSYLDFNFNYNINKNFNVYFNANNILNQPLRYFQGKSDRVFQMEYYNTRFDLGVKYDLYRSRTEDVN